MKTGSELILFDFSLPESALSWGPIDDRVMGGVSRSALANTGAKNAVFSGRISFERHGGFASVRSGPGRFDLSGYTGLALRVRGDGKVYKLSLTTEPRFDSVVYRARFSTEPDRWLTIEVPFDRFLPTFRGDEVPGAPPLDPGAIRTFGFLISDRQEGPFELEIEWIKAYGK